jgi:hypothetical protein
MTPFERGFYEELQKLGFTVDPNLTPQAMAQAPPIDPAFLLAAAPGALGVPPAAAEAAGGLVTPENVKAVGGTLMGLLESQMAPTQKQHVYTSLATPKDISGFRY